MATLGLGYGRRNSTTGRVERVSGRFSSDVANKRYTEFFITDCTKTLRIGGRIYPAANQVVSFVEANFADANSQLDLTGDLFVYVKATGDTVDYSNGYKLDKDEGYSNIGDIKQHKKSNLDACQEKLDDLNESLDTWDGLRTLANDVGAPASVLTYISQTIADLVKERDRLEEKYDKKLFWFGDEFGERQKK